MMSMKYKDSLICDVSIPRAWHAYKVVLKLMCTYRLYACTIIYYIACSKTIRSVYHELFIVTILFI